MANVSEYSRLTLASAQLIIILVWFCLAAGMTIPEFERNFEAENETIQNFEKLLQHYDKRIRPFFGTKNPVEVDVSIGIVSFESVSDVNLDFTVNTYLIQSWVDPRLRYNAPIDHLPPTSHFDDELWIPDVIFLNAKKAELHTITTTNRIVDIQKNGTVHLIQRLQLVLSCAMDFRYFPMDQQRCPIDLQSFEYTSDELIFQFSKSPDVPAVFVYDDYSKIPQFNILGANLEDCSKPSTIGNISCIRLAFFFQRQRDYYFFHAYIPCFMLVTLSWVSFWIDVRSAPARVSLGITTTLSMLTNSNGIRQDLPRYSYLKAIDVWYTANFSFVICALLEYALVHYVVVQLPNLKYLQKAKNEKGQTHEESKSDRVVQNDVRLTRMNRSDSNDDNYNHSGPFVSKDREEAGSSSKDYKTPSRGGDVIFRYGWGQKIDVLSRFIFPATYFFFLALYFLLSYENYDKPQFSMEDLENAFFKDEN